MDKITRNPLQNPPEEVLRAAVALSNEPAFKTILSWISDCHAFELQKLPGWKDEVDTRWAQGRAQAFLLMKVPLAEPREELLNREAKKQEYQLPRNV